MSLRSADEKHLADARFVRWQGLAAAQFTVAIALLSALSLSALGASAALVLHPRLSSSCAHGLALGPSMLMLTAVVFFCLLATVSRTLDFRLTARTARGRIDLKIFGLDKDQFGKLTWLLFWIAFSLFLVGSLLFLASAGLLLSPTSLRGA